MSDPAPDPERSPAAHLPGDPEAASELLALAYEELRRLARAHMRGERGAHTLQATALVHEAFLRLADQERVDWNGRAHFLAVAAGAMRRVLVDHARARATRKRGDAAEALTLSGLGASLASDSVDALDLAEALERLAAAHPRQARVVELRFFAGLSLEETAAVLELSRDTIKLDWRLARAWLNRELGASRTEE